MREKTDRRWPPAPGSLIGPLFVRFGWIGFCVQVALLTVPALLAAYLLLRSSPSILAKAIRLENYLSYASLIVMLFTTILFYYYTRLGKRISALTSCPPLSTVTNTLWTALWAGCIGITLSLVLLLSSAFRFLFVLMANPQTGVLFAPSIGGNTAASISALDAVGLAVLLIMHTAELMVLGLTLGLLFALPSRNVEGDPKP